MSECVCGPLCFCHPPHGSPWGRLYNVKHRYNVKRCYNAKRRFHVKRRCNVKRRYNVNRRYNAKRQELRNIRTSTRLSYILRYI